MARKKRFAPGGTALHALNRRVDRRTIFRCEADYYAFEQLLHESALRTGMRLCGYCLMPNHWHLVLWPRLDGELSRFMHRLSVTHAVRWRIQYEVVGEGALYQGRFKSFPVESDDHYLRLLRYVERNALRANLVERAEDWRFSSLWRRVRYSANDDLVLSPGPIELPDDWVDYVNGCETDAELEALRSRVERGDPYGSEEWQRKIAAKIRSASTRRPGGGPKKSRKR